MKILLTGANGFIGGHIREALSQAGHDVLAATRSQGFDFNRMLSPDDWLPHLTGVDAVINSVGIIAETRSQRFEPLHDQAPVALFRACAQAGVRRVIQVSALGVDEQAFCPYQLSKKAADDVLRELSLDWFVLRPSLVYGEGGKSSALFRFMAALPLIPLVGGGQQRIQPVHISDLTATVLQCLQATPARRTLDVVGAYPLTVREWLQTLRRLDGKRPARTLSIPVPFIMACARGAQYVVPMLHPDSLRMLQQGSVADVSLLAAFLGRMPLAVDEPAPVIRQKGV